MNTTYTNRKNPITPKFNVSEIFYALGAKKLPESLKQQLMDCHRIGDWGDMNEYHVRYVNEPSLAKMDGHVSSQYTLDNGYSVKIFTDLADGSTNVHLITPQGRVC